MESLVAGWGSHAYIYFDVHSCCVIYLPRYKFRILFQLPLAKTQLKWSTTWREEDKKKKKKKRITSEVWIYTINP